MESKSIPFSVFVSTNNIDSGDRFSIFILRGGIFYNVNKILSIPSIDKEFDLRSDINKKNADNYSFKCKN